PQAGAGVAPGTRAMNTQRFLLLCGVLLLGFLAGRSTTGGRPAPARATSGSIDRPETVFVSVPDGAGGRRYHLVRVRDVRLGSPPEGFERDGETCLIRLETGQGMWYFTGAHDPHGETH